MFSRIAGRRISAWLLAIALLAPQPSAAADVDSESAVPAATVVGDAVQIPIAAPLDVLLAQIGPLPPIPAPVSHGPLLPRPTPMPMPRTPFQLPPGGTRSAFHAMPAQAKAARPAVGPSVTPISDAQHAPRDQRAVVARFLERTGSHGTARPLDVPVPSGRRAAGPIASTGRRATSVDVNALNVTGLKPWWEFERGVAPGIGQWMVNDYWQNLLIQAQDMKIPYRGVDFSFVRTYNSYSGHDYAGTDGSNEIGQYGSGWTNSFDAHMSINNCPNSGYNYSGTGFTGFSVYDVDGARYDYCFDANGTLQPENGMQGTTLKTYDGGSFFWTLKDGTTYIFYAPYYPPAMAAYNGRLYHIAGRNSANYLHFSYGWDATAAAPSGDSSASQYLRNIWVTSDSGLQAHLYFDDFSGHRLLSTLTYPDNVTSVSYAYRGNGDLWLVSKPGNDAIATRTEGYDGYRTALFRAGGARYFSTYNNATGIGSDGAYIAFSLTGAGYNQANGVATAGWANFTPDDNTGTPLQPNAPMGHQTFWNESIGINAGYTTISDSDGHQEIQYMDATGRPIERDYYTGSQTLKTSRVWSPTNSLQSETDAAGNKTKYLRDLNNNVTGIAYPSVATSAGTFRPTKLMDYDGNNNLTAYCDETAVHASGHDWPNVSVPSSDSNCTSLAGGQPHVTVTYTTTSNEPYGELSAVTTARGYTWHYGYNTAFQGGGTDYGLVTDMSGDAVTDYDGTPRTPYVRRAYDAHGRIACAMNDANDARTTQVVMHDVLGRVTAISDADDASLQPAVGGCGKSSSLGSAASIVTRATYYADGSLATTQTPGEAVAGVSTSFNYDADGNLKKQTTHRGGQPATTRRWYDGAERLVEVELPQQQAPNRTTTGGNYAYALPDAFNFTWLTRYLYGLTGTANPSGMNGPAYGNIYQVAEYTRSNANLNSATMSWQPTRGFVYDGLDRRLSYTHYADNYSQLGLNTSEIYQYDATGQAGLLSTKTRAGTTEYEFFNYDALDRVVVDGFMDPAGAQFTPGHSYSYDANGRIAQEQSIGPGAGYGGVQFAYDSDGNQTSKADVGGTYNDAPSTISYGYYPDGRRANVSVTAQSTGGFTQQNLFRYAYRPDGMMRRESVQVPTSVSYAFNSGDFSWTYTGAGRLVQRTDPLTYTSVSGLSASSRLRSAQSVVPQARLAAARGTSRPVAEDVAQKVIAGLRRSNRTVSAREPKHPALTTRQTASAVTPNNQVIVQPCPQTNAIGRKVQSAGARSTAVVQSCCDPSQCPPPDPSPPPTPDPTPVPTAGPPTPTPAPTATPVPAKTFAPIAVGYDNTGRVNNYQIPSGGQYTTFHYDAEDDLTDYMGFGDTTHAPVHVVDAYNVRGELTSEHFFGNSGSTGAYDRGWPNTDLQPANGAMIPFGNGAQSTFNTLSGEITLNQTVSNFNAYNGAVCQQPITQMQWTPDASGRHVAGFAFELAFRPPDCNSADGVGGHVTRTFDAADHLVHWSLPSTDYWPAPGQFLYCQTAPYPDGTPAYVKLIPATISYGWGPENKLVQRNVSGSTTTNIHWDANAMLFTTDGAGHVTNLKFGTDAEILPNNELLVRDRDWTGQVVMSHDPTGYSPWQPPNPTHDACTPNNAPGLSPNFDGPKISDAPFTQLAADGYSDGYNTFQGARTFDPKMGQWTTQDPLTGNIDDPISLKPYTWNRNNARAYGDPGGRQSIPITFVNIATSPEGMRFGDWLGAILRGIDARAHSPEFLYMQAHSGIFPPISSFFPQPSTILFRAVEDTEFNDITASGQFRIPPGGSESKGFFRTVEGARNFANRMTKTNGLRYRIIRVPVSQEVLAKGYETDILGEGSAVYFEQSVLPEIGAAPPIEVIPEIIIP